MRYIKLWFSDGTSFGTSINGTDEEINQYYLGNSFNVGTGGNDFMVECIRVEFLGEDEDELTIK